VSALAIIWREYLADLRRRPLLAPAFRPARRDFGISLICMAAFVPIWLLLFWKGLALVAVALTILGFLFLLPVASLWLAVFWKTGWRHIQIFNRILIQLLLCLAVLVPLDVAGFLVARTSERITFQRGNAVAAMIRNYRADHGVFPSSLEALERERRQPLPRPTFRGEFGYGHGEDKFTLSFSGDSLFEAWSYDSTTGEWENDD